MGAHCPQLLATESAATMQPPKTEVCAGKSISFLRFARSKPSHAFRFVRHSIDSKTPSVDIIAAYYCLHPFSISTLHILSGHYNRPHTLARSCGDEHHYPSRSTGPTASYRGRCDRGAIALGSRSRPVDGQTRV